MKNISSYDEFRNKKSEDKLNEEWDIFGIGAWLSKKFGNSLLGKIFTKFEQTIKTEKDPKRMVNHLQTFLQEQQQQTEASLKMARAPEDIRDLMVNNLESIYTAISSIQATNEVGGNFKFQDLFPTKKDLAKAFSYPKEKTISDPTKKVVGSIANYVDTVLMPNLKKMSGIKENFLYEAAPPTTGTPPAAETPAAGTPPTAGTTPPATGTPTDQQQPGQQQQQQPKKNITKNQIKIGTTIKFKDPKTGQVRSGIVLQNQLGTKPNEIRIEAIAESMINEASEIIDVTNVEEVGKPSTQSPNVANLVKNARNWYVGTFLKPIFDKAKEVETTGGAAAATPGQKVGDFSNFTTDKTKNIEGVKKMVQGIRPMDANQLNQTRDAISKILNKDLKTDVGDF